MNPQNNQPEEVDIVQFFNAIGKMFKNIFSNIKNIIINVLHIFFNLLIYVKKYYIYFGAAVLVGLVFAFFNNKESVDVYKSEVTVQTNYQAQIDLQNKLDLFNNLIKNGKYEILAKQLNIDVKRAKEILYFEMEAQINDVYLAENYDDYLAKMDTTMHNNIKFKDYKNSINDNLSLYNYWTVTVRGKTPNVFYNLNDGFEKILDDNKALLKRKDNYMFALTTDKNVTLKSLSDIDSLRNVYNTVLLDNAKKQSSGSTNIVVSNDQIRGPEAAYDLFGKRSDVLQELRLVSHKINRFNHILQLKNTFPMYGKIDTGITDNLYVKYPLLGILLVYLVLFLIDFNKYLSNYQREKEAKQ